MFNKNRCEWTGSDPKMVKYHDEEWGVPVHEDNELFEFLILEGAQAGLSWSSILTRREGYQKAFMNFDVIKVALFSESDYDRLLQNPGIIRNKLKIKSAISNAKQFIKVQEEFGSIIYGILQTINQSKINLSHYQRFQPIQMFQQ
jgi:DNA-3-methyladenine glycosylase I